MPMNASRQGAPEPAPWRFEQPLHEGFTALLDPGVWSSLLQPFLGFQLGLLRSLHPSLGAPGPRMSRERLDEVLGALLELAEPPRTPEERLSRGRLMREYAEVLSLYAELMRDLSRLEGEQDQPPPPPVPNY